MQIWIHVPLDRKNKETGEQIPPLALAIEKKSMVNLVRTLVSDSRVVLCIAGALQVQAYAVSVKV